MRLRRVVFRSFGPFTNMELKFPPGPGLHVVFGPNEAGKSTAMRGLRGLLFGIPARSTDNFRFQHSQFRIEAEVENARGETLQVIRRKGNRDTLREGDDKKPVAEGVWAAMLGGLDEAQFDQLFGMDAERFADGRRLIDSGKGLVGESLFAAAAGLKGLRRLQKSLEEERDALFKPGGRIPPLNKAIRQYQDQRTQIASLQLSPDSYLVAEQVAARDRANHADLKQRRDAAREERDRLAGYRAALPVITLLQEARSRLESLRDAPRLGANFETRSQTALTAQAGAQARLNQDEENLGKVDDALKAIGDAPADPGIDLEALQSAHGVDQVQCRERVQVDTLARQEQGKARDIYRDLTGDKDWNRMDDLRLTEEQERCITDLADQAEIKRDRRNRAAADLRTAEDEYTAHVSAAMPEAVAAYADLAAAVKSIQAKGALESQAHTRRTARDTLGAKLTAKFAKLEPGVPGDWRHGAAVPVPLAAAVAEFENRFATLGNKEQTARTERDALDEELCKLGAQLEGTADSAAIPSDEELLRQRDRRDRGFGLIRRRLDGHPDAEREAAYLAESAAGLTLAEATEAGIRQSDTVADRLRHEADHLAVLRAARQSRGESHARRSQLESRFSELQSNSDALQADWKDAWRAAGIVPRTPASMREWLTHWQALLTEAGNWVDQDAVCRSDAEQIRGCCERLRQFEGMPPEPATLAELLAAAEARVKLHQDSITAREQHDSETERRRGVVVLRQRDAGTTAAAFGKWECDWRAAIAPLPLEDAAASVATAREYVRMIKDMQEHLKQERIKRSRLREIDELHRTFLDRLTAAKLALDAGAGACREDAIDDEFRDIRNAAARRTKLLSEWTKLTEDHGTHSTKLAKSKEECAKAAAAVAALLAEAGAAAVDDLPEIQQKARRRGSEEEQVRLQEKALAECAAGIPLEEFMIAALAARDGLNLTIEDLDRRITDSETEIESADAKARESEGILEEHRKGSAAAADARQQAAMIADTLREHAVEYAARHVALAALQRAVESYRARHADSMLICAGQHFRLLTHGAFTGIDIENDEGEDVLVGLRAGDDRPDVRVRIDGFSAGTRDQLFLALRLAGIEQHLATRESMPLILDDLLVNFDDSRSAATLTCLSELAKRTQVLLFTHHQHVVELARQTCPSIHIGNMAGAN